MGDFSSDPDFKYLWVDRKKVMQEMANFDGKKACWVPDEQEGFTRGEIVPPREMKSLSRSSGATRTRRSRRTSFSR